MAATVLEWLSQHVILLVFALLGLGAVLGQVRVAGVGIGPAAVLFTAIGFGALAAANDVVVAVPAVVGTAGLVLFTYCIGLQNGLSFFAGLRTAVWPMVWVVVLLCVVAASVVGLGRVLDLPAGVVAGTFAGGATNTPALAAAIDAAGDTAGPTVGYSVAYVFGVLGMLACAAVALRSSRADASPDTELTSLTARVEGDRDVHVADLLVVYSGAVTFSRVQRGESNPIEVIGEDGVLRAGDLVTVVGPPDVAERVARHLGHPSSHALQRDHRYLDTRRVTLSRPEFAGQTVADLGLHERFGAVVTRVRRGDADLVARGSFVLQPGDRLRVIAPSAQIDPVSRYLGDSSRGFADINPVGLGLGMALGVGLGAVVIPTPGGGFALGAAAGTLVVGLLFGRLGRVGPVVTSMAHSASSTLAQLGLLLFLVWAGVTAGEQLAQALDDGVVPRVLLLGAVATVLLGAGVLLAGKVLPGIGAARLAGMLAGTQTQPAVLAYANEHTDYDPRVSLGYTLVFPAAMVTKIVLGQVLGGL